jgi:predicted metalloprotease with PDZ domain
MNTIVVKEVLSGRKPGKLIFLLTFLIAAFCLAFIPSAGQSKEPSLQYSVSMPGRNNHLFHVELSCAGWDNDTIDLKMPKWMPGYYQVMNYANNVRNFSVRDQKNVAVTVNKLNDNTWRITGKKGKSFKLSYDVVADRKFVANPYVDSSHAYIVPAGLFFYFDGHINNPVSVKIDDGGIWKDIATGLQSVAGRANEFTAPDFDILYDSPLLIGNLEELPSFTVNGATHRFIGYQMGDFDRKLFMKDLKKMVEAAVEIIGDIPFKEYTFIGIGPGQGGIEHLNNTTVSFDGKGLNNQRGRQRMLSFLAHEYFHHYNVKRIRPFELGPFNYDGETKTNLLWVSEGLSVYYEHLILERAGLTDEQTLLNTFASQITTVENSPGRHFQSLAQASFETWSDGPFGKQGKDADKSISYYTKGPVVGLLLDFSIRQASQNKKSLDDVFRFLYWKYYKELKRGFTDAEFQQACEMMAGVPLTMVFEYVYTTKDPDYETILAYAGLSIREENDAQTGKRKISIARGENISPAQAAILESWLGR